MGVGLGRHPFGSLSQEGVERLYNGESVRSMGSAGPVGVRRFRQSVEESGMEADNFAAQERRFEGQHV